MFKNSADDIIQGILSCNENVISSIYKENYQVIRQLINTNSGNDDDTADIFQDTMMVIYQKAKEGKLKIYVAFGTYFYSIAKRLWFDELRKRKLKNLVPEKEDIEIIDDNEDFQKEILYNERHKLVWKYFEKLTDDCKKIIKLFIEENSIAQVTNIMQFNSEQHTKNRRLRCKNRLITLIINDPQFKKLKNEKVKDTDQISRW
jgi:RNA polymerase sigma factor (sigma-70 family)